MAIFSQTSCSTDNSSTAISYSANKLQQNENKLKNEFEEYLETLDKIPLPLTYCPFAKLPELSKNYNKDSFEKYKHIWTSQPLGILYSDTNIVTLIDCSIGDMGLVPFLTTFDRKGNKLDSLAPFKKTGDDMGYHALEYLTINKNGEILVADTVETYALSQDSTVVNEGSIKIQFGTTKYFIDNNGHFKTRNISLATPQTGE